MIQMISTTTLGEKAANIYQSSLLIMWLTYTAACISTHPIQQTRPSS